MDETTMGIGVSIFTWETISQKIYSIITIKQVENGMQSQYVIYL